MPEGIAEPALPLTVSFRFRTAQDYRTRSRRNARERVYVVDMQVDRRTSSSNRPRTENSRLREFVRQHDDRRAKGELRMSNSSVGLVDPQAHNGAEYLRVELDGTRSIMNA